MNRTNTLQLGTSRKRDVEKNSSNILQKVSDFLSKRYTHVDTDTASFWLKINFCELFI